MALERQERFWTHTLERQERFVMSMYDPAVCQLAPSGLVVSRDELIFELS